MASTENRGQLVIVGGAEDKDGDCKILREFLRCAGGIKARIVVMTAATSLPGEVGDNYIRVFERLGAEDVRVVDTQGREDVVFEVVSELLTGESLDDDALQVDCD